ncbi:hypothetical protein SLS53_002403 [Cytospora paraplurivora]|uniref:Beta-lactamase-related domain-containing protein n=1 Tax=Cytospora paraplurivora TaxID=2898453 RepID=A0AAN9ULL7_9PEZI
MRAFPMPFLLSTLGFGYASFPSEPVTPHTLFVAGSTTKSFTAAGLSLLIDNSSDYSSIQWTTPISQLLREDFVLSDDWATAHITIEDALSHRTGYPRHDLAIGNDTRDMVRSLRHLPLSAEPRSRFQYNNMMYGAAGYLISKLTGSSLVSFFHRYLWTPMGMNETFLNLDDPLLLEASGLSVANGYWWVNSTGEYVRQPMDASALRADEGAGAVVSNVLDYVKYLRVMMAEAGPVSRAGHRELKAPRTFMELEREPFVGPVAYGLGWMSTVFEGERVYMHTGTVTPFVTFMLMVPSRKYGIVIMANSYSKVRELVTYRILYDLFGVEEGRRVDFEAKFQREEALARQAVETCPERIYPDTPDPPIPTSVPLANHTGHYHHAGYGHVFVDLICHDQYDSPSALSSAQPKHRGACQLQLRRGPENQAQLSAKLEHKTGDYWLAWAFIDEVPDEILVCVRTQFRVDASGIVTHVGADLRLEGEDGPLVWFERDGD